uniref:Putative secreted protein n=1 Tax=Anopheles triannulatus TaxID=58253 RepID=A0A2M4B4X2_9DIPT
MMRMMVVGCWCRWIVDVVAVGENVAPRGVVAIVGPCHERHDGRLLDTVVRERVEPLPAVHRLRGDVFVAQHQMATATVAPLEIEIMDGRTEGKGCVLEQRVQDFTLHLADCITVQHLTLHLLIQIVLDDVQRNDAVSDLFAQQTLLAQRVPGIVCDRIHQPLLDLVLDGFVEQKKRVAGIVAQVIVHAQCHVVRQHLLHDALRPAEHQLRVLRHDRLFDQPEQQTLQDVRHVVHLVHQYNHQQ